MKKSFILLSLIAAFAFSGCGWLNCLLFGPQGDNTSRDRSATFYINVVSNPSGADVIFKGQVLGQTPARNMPIRMTYQQVGGGMFMACTGWDAVIPENEYIYVKKEGYKLAGGKLEFKNNKNGALGLVTKSYSVDLRKEE